MRNPLSIGGACGLALLAATSAALADDVQDHVDRAATLVKEERFWEALAELRAARAIRQSPRLLYRIAQVEQRLGDARAAIDSYEGFLAAEPEADAELGRDAQAQLAKLRSLIAEPPPLPPPVPKPFRAPVVLTARDPDEKYVVGTDRHDCVTPCRLWVKPGPQRVHASNGEGTIDLQLDVPRRGGFVRVYHARNGLLISGVVLMTVGSVMMIAGTVGALRSFTFVDDDLGGFGGGSGAASGASIALGWVVGPIAHLVGIGLMAGAVAKLPDSNTLRPVGVELAPAAHGATARLKLSF